MTRTAEGLDEPTSTSQPPGRRKWRRRLILALVLAIVLTVAVGHRELGSRPLLAWELVQMGNADRAAREARIKLGQFEVGQELTDEQLAVLSRVEELDRRHEARLSEIIDKHDWPGRSLVGRSGAHAAWLIAQHATLEFQRRVLPLIKDGSGVRPAEIAKLEDRIRVREGREQLYGTQWTCRNGQLELSTPVDDAALAEERRAEVGLSSIDENRDRLLDRDGPCPD